MSSKLFVGGLSFSTTDAGLRAAFEPHGEILEARVVLDRETGRSRGFGFVSYRRPEDARQAVERMTGAMLDGRSLRVDLAEDRRGPGGPGGGPPRGDRPPREGFGGPRRDGWGAGPPREGGGPGGPRRESFGGGPGGFQRGGPGGDRGGPGGFQRGGPGGDRGGPGGFQRGGPGGDRGGPGGFQRGGPGGDRGGPGGFQRGDRGGGFGGPSWQPPAPEEAGWDDARIRRTEPKKHKTRAELEADRKAPKVAERPKRLSGKSWRQWGDDDEE